MVWKTDDYLMEKIDKTIPLYCKFNIHPNIITLIGLVIALSLPYIHHLNLHWIVFIAIIIRQYFDCLDGAVARTCEKTSKLGGYLDTLADIIFNGCLIYIFLVIFTKNHKLSLNLSIITMTLVIIIHVLIIGSNVLHDHSIIKKCDSDTSLFICILSFFPNNTFLIYSVVAISYLVLQWKLR